MKMELTFARTVCDPMTAWVDLVKVDAEVPDWLADSGDSFGEYHLIGGTYVREAEE